MKKYIETWLIFIFLSLFTVISLYPVLNIVGVSLRTDNAFQSKSLSLLQKPESFDDLNKNGKWDRNEQFEDKNLNGMYDRGSSFNSYKTLFLKLIF